MKNKNLDLSQGNVTKVFVMFFLPMMIGGLLQQLYSATDAVIVGRFAGKQGLAAIDSVFQLFKFPLNFLSGLSGGASVVISNFCGAKKEKDLDEAVHTSILLGLIIGIVLSAMGGVFAAPLIKIMNVPDDIFYMSLIYVRIYFCGLWTTTMYNLLSGVLRAVGDSATPLKILFLCCVVNISLDLILVGALHTGIVGAAAATIIAQLISAILALRTIAKNPLCNFRLSHLKITTDKMLRIFKVGVPIGLQSMLYPIANSIISASINGLGTVVIAARGIEEKLTLLIWLIVDTLNPALATYVSQNLGAEKPERVKQGVRVGVMIAVGALICISAILYFFGGTIAKLFVGPEDYDVIPVIMTCLSIEAPFFFMYTFSQGLSGVICGTGDSFKAMICTLSGTCLLRVVWRFTVVKKIYCIQAISWGYVASWVVTSIIFIVYYFRVRRRGFIKIKNK